jgi:hypothetical protein
MTAPLPDDPPAALDAARAGAIVTRLPGTAILDVSGPDARAFLQGQFSNDVDALAPGTAQWSTYNSPKGRMLATPLLWRRPGDDREDRFRIAIAADLAEAVRKRLSMYVLRSKVVIAAATLEVVGIGGPGAAAALRTALGLEVSSLRVAPVGDGEAVGLPDGRVLLAVPPPETEALVARLASVATPADERAWRWLGLRAGVVEVRLATQEKHIAQTANWEVVGGVSFTKGCYPGQEIVARIQHLGFLKERAHPFRVDAPPPEPNTRIYLAGTDQTAGLVVDAVAVPGGGSDLIAVVHLVALEGDLRLGAPDGPALERLPLPYTLPVSTPKRVKL